MNYMYFHLTLLLNQRCQVRVQNRHLCDNSTLEYWRTFPLQLHEALFVGEDLVLP